MINMTIVRTAWIIPLLSMGIEMRPDSSETNIGFAYGEGSYAIVSRGCQGEVLGADEVTFRTSSGFLEHTSDGKTKLGVRYDRVEFLERRNVYSRDAYGYSNQSTREPPKSFTCITGYGGIETKAIGADIGGMYQQRSATVSGEMETRYDPYVRLRLGRLDRLYLEGGYLSTMTLYSSGGLFTYGVGIPVNPEKGRLWIGVDAEPFDASAFLARGELALFKNVFLRGSVRLGSTDADAKENCFAVGFRYRFKD